MIKKLMASAFKSLGYRGRQVNINSGRVTTLAPGALDDLGPLYHSYSFFGVENEQISGIYKPNQIAKSQIITAYLAFAFARASQQSSGNVSFAELFCADGYYAMVASSLGCHPCHGIDNNRDNYTNFAPEIAARLGLEGVHFLSRDIKPNSSMEKYDIVANVGGLYHTENPEGILELSYNMAKSYLIVQNVVSLANHSDEYFESPAPGWTWGSRYSKESFDMLVRKRFGNKIIYSHFNELTGNERAEDRGSAYYLIEK